MDKKKRAIVTILVYFLVMIIGVIISNKISNLIGGNIIDGMQVDEDNIIQKLIIQIPPTICIIYMIKKYYGWENAGFTKANKKSLIWFLPYVIVLIFMLKGFIVGIYTSINSFDINTYKLLILTFLGVSMAGFCEEVIFRGIVLDSFKSDKSMIGAMIFSSLGFSICHITTLIMGIPVLDVLWRVISSSLLGFSFVGLVIKINNIWPIILFHIIWNYIIMASHAIRIEISIAAGLCNILNIVMAVVLWSIIIKDEMKKKKALI
ncbi:MAG: CPBP family intramembrane glutamic endopeptidase [Terrisporobacter sp.]|uniref:CPBP family intramembrane glutamic endopeptidase n=1 Tax=Terrisporobacter sp. TaxID=1965305 RepID=UPI002FCBF84F